MTVFAAMSNWLLQRVKEIEARYDDPSDPRAEDVRQLVESLKQALRGAQQVYKIYPQAGEIIMRRAAEPFAGHDGYDPSWRPPN